MNKHPLTCQTSYSVCLSVNYGSYTIYLFFLLIRICLSWLCLGICWATKACFRGSEWSCMLMKTFFSLVKLARRVPSAAQRELTNSASAPRPSRQKLTCPSARFLLQNAVNKLWGLLKESQNIQEPINLSINVIDNVFTISEQIVFENMLYF